MSVEGYDASACGGTHVAFTGEVGPIHVRRAERRRGQTRVEFLCGRRAQRDLYWRDALLQSVAAGLSVGVADLPAAVARLQEEQRTAQKALEAARQDLLTYRVAELAAGAETLPNGWRVVCCVLEGFDAAAMRLAANTLIAAAGTVALLGVLEPAPRWCWPARPMWTCPWAPCSARCWLPTAGGAAARRTWPRAAASRRTPCRPSWPKRAAGWRGREKASA